MKPYLYLCAMLAGLAAAVPAQATPVLTLDRIGTALIGPGGSVSYELRLTTPDATIGAFSLDIAFNPDVLAFHAAATPAGQFGTLLGDPQLEALDLADVPAAGTLHLDEVSLLDGVTLGGLQRDAAGNPLGELVLAQISFDAIGMGAGQLGFAAGGMAFSDADGRALSLPFVVTPDAVFVVPTPPTLALFLPGLLALALWQRRARRPRRRDGRAGWLG